MSYTVLIPDNVHQAALDVMAKANGRLSIQNPGKLSKDELLVAVGSAHALIIRSAVGVDSALLSAAPLLKVIVRAGTGVDNIDLEDATRRGVVVMNTPAGNSIAAAEHAFGLMLALARHIPQGHMSLGSGKWDRQKFQGVELREKTLGIVGFGRIGQAVAKRAHAFEMKTIAYDPYNPQIARLCAEHRAELVDLDTLYKRSDFITLHPWLSDETRGMINKDSIAKMKKGIRIVNIARGALIVDEDLAEAIKSGHVAGAAVDVYHEEPPPSDNPLLNLPGVVHTPHLAASTEEAQIAVAVEAAHHTVEALLHGDYQNVVNPDVLKTLAQP
jgi:D-3-phosphoglycerate dehydrogenase